MGGVLHKVKVKLNSVTALALLKAGSLLCYCISSVKIRLLKGVVLQPFELNLKSLDCR